MPTYKISTDFYVPPNSVQESAVQPVRKFLESRGWTVAYIDCEPKSSWSGGVLAQWHPVDLALVGSGTEKKAKEDVDEAITSLGLWSVAGALATRVTQVGGAAADAVEGVGQSFDPDAPTSPILRTAQFLAVAVVAVAVVALVVYAAPMIRTARAASKGQAAT